MDPSIPSGDSIDGLLQELSQSASLADGTEVPRHQWHECDIDALLKALSPPTVIEAEESTPSEASFTEPTYIKEMHPSNIGDYSPWFSEAQTSDRINPSRPMACAITTYDKNGDVLGHYGTLHHDSCFRFHPILHTSLPTFEIQVRRKRVANDDFKDVVEFDPDLLSCLSVHYPLDTDPNFDDLMLGDGETPPAPPSGGRLGLVKCRLDPSVFRPVRSYGVLNGFDADSPQHKFFAELSKARGYTIVVAPQDDDCHTNYCVYGELIKIREVMSAGALKNDWWLAGQPSYNSDAPMPFIGYLNNLDLQLPAPTWLKKSEAGRRLTKAYDYISAFKAPKNSFPFMRMYTTIHMKGLLQEREEATYLVRQQFQPNMRYTAKVQQTFQQHAMVHVTLGQAAQDIAGHRVVPNQGSRCTIIFDGYRSSHHGDTSCKGEVCAEADIMADFTVDVEIPQALLDAGFELHDNQEYRVQITVNPVHLDIENKLACMAYFMDNSFPRHLGNNKAAFSGGEKRGYFEIGSLIGEQRLGIFSPDFHQEFKDRKLPYPYQCQVERIVKELLQASGLNDVQRQTVDRLLTGVRSNTFIIEGLPGTGKTYTVARYVVILLLLGQKVLITAQSNAGVTALFQHIRQLLASRTDLQYLRLLDHCARVFSVAREKEIEERAVMNELGPLKLPTEEYSLYSCVERYARAHPQSKNVLDYKEWQRVKRREGKTTHVADRPFQEVLLAVQKDTLATMQLVACTTFVAQSLHPEKLDFQADVAVLDEAAQCSEPDAMVMLAAQMNLRQFLLSGDVFQLWPVVQSNSAGTGNYANFLACPLQQRLLQGYPFIEKAKLCISYRGHPDTIAMASRLFYHGQLQPASAAEAPNFDTPLAKNVKAVMSHGEFFGGALDTERVLSADMRQYFFDVDSLPEQGEQGLSWINKGGVNAIIDFVSLILREARPSVKDIGIITMYKDDLKFMRKRLQEEGIAGVEVEVAMDAATVDSFQGRDKPIIIVHLVAGFEDRVNPFGFVKHPNRLCVATTRSREFQFLFANFSFWRAQLQAPRVARAHKAIRELVNYGDSHQQMVKWNDVSVANFK